MTKNAKNWPKMIRAVYASIGTGRHSGDGTTKRVMDRAVSWLTAGLTLSPKLQAAVLRNIEQRTKYGAIDPCAPISLTRNQLAYAHKTNPEWFELGFDNVDLEPDEEQHDYFSTVFTPEFSEFYAQFQQDFRDLSAAFPHESLALARELSLIAAENCEKLEAQFEDASAKVKESRVEVSGEGMASASAPASDLSSPTMSHEVAAAAPGSDPDPHEAAPSRFPPSVTLWVKENKAGKVAASGFIEVSGERFALLFAPYENALECMAQNSSGNWLKQFDLHYNQALKANEQSSTGVASRATLSALYAKHDTHAYKPPEVADHAMVIAWENNAPSFALLVDSQLEWHRFDFRQEAKDRFKGTLAKD